MALFETRLTARGYAMCSRCEESATTFVRTRAWLGSLEPLCFAHKSELKVEKDRFGTFHEVLHADEKEGAAK